MALREAVGAEPLQLAEGPLGELPLVAVVDHPLDELVLEVRHPAGELERRHGPAELVGLPGREPGALDGDLHRLLLEQRHAQRLAQHALEFLLGVVHRLRASPAAAGRGAPCRPGSGPGRTMATCTTRS